MNTSQRCIAIAALTLTASAFAPVAAVAADSNDNPPSRSVSYKGLDLNRESDARTLYERIRSAAESVCAPLNGRQLIARMNQTACVTGAVERAVNQVNQPGFTRYYLTRNPKWIPGTSHSTERWAASTGETR